MSDTMVFVLAFAGVLLLVGLAYILPNECSQEKTACNCKGNKDGKK